jgi:hypothetical protein
VMDQHEQACKQMLLWFRFECAAMRHLYRIFSRAWETNYSKTITLVLHNTPDLTITFGKKCGQLEAKTLATSSGHNEETVPAWHGGIHGLQLHRPQLPHAKHGQQLLL